MDYELDAEALARLLYLMDEVQYEWCNRAHRRRKGVLFILFGVAIVVWLNIPDLIYV